MNKERSRENWIALIVRRIFAHITRRSSLAAWLVAALCLLIYFYAPIHDSKDMVHESIRSVLMTLFSLSLGAVFLPELPSNLWSIDVNKVKNLIPEVRRIELARTLIKAESEDESWTDLVWHSALEPLVQASRQPWTYVWDMDYDASIHLGRNIDIGGKPKDVSSVAIEHKSRRFLANPEVSERWLTVSRTVEALKDEYDLPGCLAREVALVPGISAADWHEFVVPRIKASIMINGEDVPLESDAGNVSRDVIRWRLDPSFDVPQERALVVINFEFPYAADESMFMVAFSSYYVAGAVEIGLKLFNAPEGVVLDADHFIGEALHKDWKPNKKNEVTDICSTCSYHSGRQTILWPGSGVNFYWK